MQYKTRENAIVDGLDY